MARGRTGKPRFYCNVLEWCAVNGMIGVGVSGDEGPHSLDPIFRTLPVSPKLYNSNITASIFAGRFNFGKQAFVACLGHEFGTNEFNFSVASVNTNNPLNSGDDETTDWEGLIDVVNGYPGNTKLDGYSIMLFNGEGMGTKDISLPNIAGINIGSIVIGTYIDLNSPEMNISMSVDMDGYKRKRQKEAPT